MTTTLAPSPSFLRPTRPAAPPLGPLGTVANAITIVRTLAAVVIAVIGISASRPGLLGVAYAVYWLGDMLDGLAARRLGQETRLGAVLDIISDRACTSVLAAGLVAAWPRLAWVVLPFFLSFMVLDTMVSLAFLGWPILSPNHFGRVDARVYRLNWSPPAKALNTAGVVLLAVTGILWAAVLLTLVLIAVKVYSAVRVVRLMDGAAR